VRAPVRGGSLDAPPVNELVTTDRIRSNPRHAGDRGSQRDGQDPQRRSEASAALGALKPGQQKKVRHRHLQTRHDSRELGDARLMLAFADAARRHMPAATDGWRTHCMLGRWSSMANVFAATRARPWPDAPRRWFPSGVTERRAQNSRSLPYSADRAAGPFAVCCNRGNAAGRTARVAGPSRSG
jgi:hypothetical protein